jgi:hypothetical protein
MKKILGTLSPAYGMATGHGMFGKIADSGLGGIIPTALAQDRKKEAREKEMAEKAANGMKKGGYVKAADGCAKRGKTRGKMA